MSEKRPVKSRVPAPMRATSKNVHYGNFYFVRNSKHSRYFSKDAANIKILMAWAWSSSWSSLIAGRVDEPCANLSRIYFTICSLFDQRIAADCQGWHIIPIKFKFHPIKKGIVLKWVKGYNRTLLDTILGGFIWMNIDVDKSMPTLAQDTQTLVDQGRMSWAVSWEYCQSHWSVKSTFNEQEPGLWWAMLNQKHFTGILG